MAPKQTPSQTIGPFFAYGLTSEQYGYDYKQLAGNTLPEESAERIRIRGQVFDGNGGSIRDAMLEIWQADSQGRYAQPGNPRVANTKFSGFARFSTGTLENDFYEFETVKPGAIGDGQAPHIAVVIFMRGLLNHVYTRIYFPDETLANETDPVLSLVDPARRDTLIAQQEAVASYRFDVHMQGERETVFFDP